MSQNWDKLIVALDLEDKAKIKEVVDILGPKGVKFKIGSIAFTKFGPKFLKSFIDEGRDIFLDLKLYDIPNTMRRTAAVIAEMGCWAFTVHLQAGAQALKAVKEEVKNTAKACGKNKPMILGVSVLTSSSMSMEERKKEIEKRVQLAQKLGIEGVISSPLDVKRIKEITPELKVITPGIRNSQDDKGDQKRITTASEAFSNGADYIVVGRPIIREKNYLEAAERILEN